MAIALRSIGQHIIPDGPKSKNRITTVGREYREGVIWQCP